MKLLLALVVVSAVSVSAGEDWKMFMKWAKTKAMESCWGEENMKLLTLNMKKAVSKCLQEDAPELDLPPFRYLNRFTNKMVSMTNNNHGHGYGHHDEDNMMEMMKMMMMVKMMQSFNYNENRDHDYTRHGPCDGSSYHDCHSIMPKEKMMKMMMMKMMNSHDSHDSMDDYTRMSGSGKMDYMNMDDMDMESMFSKMFKNMKSSRRAEPRSDDYSPMMKRFMGGYQKRQADDSLALNDRLKEKLERLMEDHVSEMSNMTCVLREMNVLDTRNKIDVAAMKADSQNYNMPSEWFKQEYFSILDNCYEVAENQPAELDNMFNMPGMQHMGKVKSFLTCKKSAKMRLCMNQDTKKKIETNFGPVEELLQSFNNQINEEQLFFMVNELLQGSEQEWM